MNASTKEILALNRFDARRGMDGSPPPPDLAERLARREASFGASSVLFYEQPIEMVRAEGVYMYDARGKRYLDVYNNVPSVGHCHPRVVEAVSRQIGELNVNSRYLNRVVETYAEMLLATFPDELSNVVLTCTGSEANDLAMRIARIGTGGEGFIVTESAYHGNTALVTEISPSSLRIRRPAAYVRTVPAPANGATFAAFVEEAIHDLKSNGIKIAALIVDTIFSSDGIFADPPGFLRDAVEVVKREGGLLIADEVQPGFGRTGDGLWGFSRHGVLPDVVTLGKPMGNGFPMGGVVTHPNLLKQFCLQTGYFNTFGGNPVAAAAGRAVLDVITEEKLIERSRTVGDYLKQLLVDASDSHAEIGDVRGAGLFIGVDIINPETRNPDVELATYLTNEMKNAGILISIAGKFGATLKVRPPLCFSKGDADFFCWTLNAVLEQR